VKGERNPADHIGDILEASAQISQFIKGMNLEGFSKDNKTQFAVIRGLEIIGEAARKVPLTFREKNPDVPWREITGMRDKLIHDYIDVNTQIVWKTVTEDLPALELKLRKMLDEPR